MDDLDARLRRRLAALADAAAHEEPAPLVAAAVRPVRRGGRTQSARPVGALGLVAVLVVALVAIAPRLVGQPAFIPSASASHSPTTSVVASVTASPTASVTAVPEKPSPWPGESPSPTALPVLDAERFSASAVAFFDRQHGLIGGDSAGQGVIWRTDDGGATYAKQLVPAPGILAIAVTGSAEAWAAAPSALLHSADAGRTWQKISSVELGSVSFVDSRRGWGIQTGDIATGVRSGGLISTIDGGRTWTPEAAEPCQYDPQIRPTFPAAVTISFVDALHGWVGCSWVVGAGQGPRAISMTTDGGKTWRFVAADVPPAGPYVGQISSWGYLTGLAMRPSGIGFYWAQRGVGEKTTDGGRTWTSIPPSKPDEVTVGSAWLLDDRDWLALVRDGAASTPQTLQATSDGGQTWRVVSNIPLPPY
jgi:photosystem II stability/assembly factor-like uncharacterized protein